MRVRKMIAACLVAAMPFSVAACTDEDDDGAVTDEEIGELDEEVDEGVDEMENDNN
jgi:hypothetical protein